MFIWNDFTHIWKYTTTIKVVIWRTFPFSSSANEFKSSRKSEEYLYAGTPALELVAFLNNGSRLCCSGAGTRNSVTRLHFTRGRGQCGDHLRLVPSVSQDWGGVTVCGRVGRGGGECYTARWSGSWQARPGSENVTGSVWSIIQKNVVRVIPSLMVFVMLDIPSGLMFIWRALILDLDPTMSYA